MGKWKIDPAHSELGFKVKHLMINNVKGQFKSYSGEVETEDFKKAKISVTVDPTSIDTSNEQRDQHLKSGEFFSVEKLLLFISEAAAFMGINWLEI